jgi:hypothetical protein
MGERCPGSIDEGKPPADPLYERPSRADGAEE